MVPTWATAVVRVERLDDGPDRPGVADSGGGALLFRVQFSLEDQGRELVGPALVTRREADQLLAVLLDRFYGSLTRG